MIAKKRHVGTLSSNEERLLYKISDIIHLCESSDTMMVNIYLLQKKGFIYCNNALKSIIGNTCKDFFSNGWENWFSKIDLKDSQYAKTKILAFFTAPYINDSCVLKYHILSINDHSIFIKHDIFLHKLNNQIIALNYFFDITEKEQIENCFKSFENSRHSIVPKEHTNTISLREKEVLELIADGFSSKQIAHMLYISDHTAVSHRKNLIQKFRVKNTAQLIKKASKIFEF